MRRFVDAGSRPRLRVRHTARAAGTGLHRYMRAEAAAAEGERAMWHRTVRPTAYEAAANARPAAHEAAANARPAAYETAANARPTAHEAAANARPSETIDPSREAQA